MQKKGGYSRRIALLAVWMLLAAQREAKIDSDEQHAILTHDFAKCIEVDGGILGHLLWTVTDLLFVCNKLVI